MALASDAWVFEHTNDLTATPWALSLHAIDHGDEAWLRRYYLVAAVGDQAEPWRSQHAPLQLRLFKRPLKHRVQSQAASRKGIGSVVDRINRPSLPVSKQPLTLIMIGAGLCVHETALRRAASSRSFFATPPAVLSANE